MTPQESHMARSCIVVIIHLDVVGVVGTKHQPYPVRGRNVASPRINDNSTIDREANSAIRSDQQSVHTGFAGVN